MQLHLLQGHLGTDDGDNSADGAGRIVPGAGVLVLAEQRVQRLRTKDTL